MLPKSSPRPTNPYPIEIILRADQAEKDAINSVVRWRVAWAGVFIEIVAIARAAGRHDVGEAIRHSNHLAARLVWLRLDAIEKKNGRGLPAPTVEEVANISGYHRRTG